MTSVQLISKSGNNIIIMIIKCTKPQPGAHPLSVGRDLLMKLEGPLDYNRQDSALCTYLAMFPLCSTAVKSLHPLKSLPHPLLIGLTLGYEIK